MMMQYTHARQPVIFAQPNSHHGQSNAINGNGYYNMIPEYTIAMPQLVAAPMYQQRAERTLHTCSFNRLRHSKDGEEQRKSISTTVLAILDSDEWLSDSEHEVTPTPETKAVVLTPKASPSPKLGTKPVTGSVRVTQQRNMGNGMRPNCGSIAPNQLRMVPQQVATLHNVQHRVLPTNFVNNRVTHNMALNMQQQQQIQYVTYPCGTQYAAQQSVYPVYQQSYTQNVSHQTQQSYGGYGYNTVQPQVGVGYVPCAQNYQTSSAQNYHPNNNMVCNPQYGFVYRPQYK